MSFILDALKKSESERQSQGTAEFSGVPSTARPARGSRWPWILGLLLAINLAVLLGLLLRPDHVPPVATVSQVDKSPPLETTRNSFAEQVSAARQNIAPIQAPPVQTTPEPLLATQPAMTSWNSGLVIPSIHAVRASGAIGLPDLHLDIHVYSAAAEDRFVFINMSKQREGSRLSEGPVVAEITPEGVVLNYQGISFLLTRD